jgi:hypothetical protein
MPLGAERLKYSRPFPDTTVIGFELQLLLLQSGTTGRRLCLGDAAFFVQKLTEDAQAT